MQLVLKHNCKTSWKTILRVLPPSFKPVLHEQIRLLLVAWILTSDRIKVRGNHARPGFTSLVAKQVCLGRVERATSKHFVAKSRTNLYFLQKFFATSNNLICCKTGLNLGVKMTSNIAFLLFTCICGPFDLTLKCQLSLRPTPHPNGRPQNQKTSCVLSPVRSIWLLINREL